MSFSSQMVDDQFSHFNSIELLKSKPTHLLVFIHHVMLQFDCAPVVRTCTICACSFLSVRMHAHAFTLVCEAQCVSYITSCSAVNVVCVGGWGGDVMYVDEALFV